MTEVKSSALVAYPVHAVLLNAPAEDGARCRGKLYAGKICTDMQ